MRFTFKPSVVLFFSLISTLIVSTAQAKPKKANIKSKMTIGMIQDASCGDYCYLTILRKDNNKTQGFMGTGDVMDDEGNIKKKYQGVDVKVLWHRERHYIPEGGAYQTDDMVDRVEVLK